MESRPTSTQRRLGPYSVSAIGFGCMNLSHAYGPALPLPAAEAVLRRALELGVTHFDTAALYGFGANEELVGRVLRSRSAEVFIATKCGVAGRDGKRVIDGSPAAIRVNCEDSLRRLQVDAIDLYYLHRLDKSVPVEDSIGAMAELVRAGKVRAIGLSEVSAQTLKRAQSVHSIAAVQSEYSLMTRNPELGVLELCRASGVSFVAFSPLGRGFLTGALPDPGQFAAGDIRRGMPRFAAPHLQANRATIAPLREVADQYGCTIAQVSLAWLLAKENLVAIPGTTQTKHLEENLGAASIVLDSATIARLDKAINQNTVSGPRYPASTQPEIDTEEFTVG
jgi:aryl-alcohol dehydrogenase-like predicted oxidoreductase